MKKSNIISRAVLFSMLLVFYALSAQVVHANSKVRFRLLHDYLIIVPVWLNGSGPYDFLLDTGTNSTMIDSELAERVDLHPIDRTILVSVTSEQPVVRGTIQSLSLGEKTVERIEVLSSDVSQLRTLDPKVRGVLGQNFLSRFNFLLDYKKRLVEFEDGGSLKVKLKGNHVPVELDEGRLMLNAYAALNREVPARLVLDSGTRVHVIFGDAIRKLELVGETEQAETSNSALINGKRLPTSQLKSLKIGDEIFHELQTILVFENAGSQLRSEDGLLPTVLFNSIYFNNQDKYVILNPRS